MQVKLRLCHIIEQKFQNQGTAKSPAFDFEIRKSHGHVDIFDIIDADKARIFHCFRKTVTMIPIRSSTAMIRSVFSKVFAADRFITDFPVLTTEPAAFIAQKFHLVFLGLGQRIPFIKSPVQAKIRYGIKGNALREPF